MRGPLVKPLLLLRATRQALDRQRGIDPAPITYAVPALVGALAGLALRRRLGRSSWIPAVALPAAVWCVATTDAFWGGRARQTAREVRLRVGLALHPEQGAERMRRDAAARIRFARLPLYGLEPAWQGRRSLGGWGSGPSGVTRVTLVHGDAGDGTGPFLDVELSEPDAFARDQHVRRQLVRRLRTSRHHQTASAEQPPPPTSGPGVSVWAVTVGASALGSGEGPPPEAPDPPEDAWHPVAIPVDGEEVAFSYLEEDGAWVAWADLPAVRLTLHAHGVPVSGVRLQRVADAGAYLGDP